LGRCCQENEGKQLRQHMIDFPESKGFFTVGALLAMEGRQPDPRFAPPQPVVLNSVSEEIVPARSSVVQSFR